MALPPNVKALLQSESHGAHANHMTSAKANITSSNNIVRHSAARMVDEASPQSAAATNKILNLPS
jgi:hypothetical protein